MTDAEVMAAFERHMQTAHYSPITVRDRLEFVARLAAFLPHGLLAAAPADLERFQQSFSHLSRASVDVYSRHVLALYRWLLDTDRLATDPTRRMVKVKPRKGLPHPITERDLQVVLACAPAALRLAYMLAAFAGLRAGEITRLRSENLSLTGAQPTAFIQGKGGRERIVLMLSPVVHELQTLDLPGRWVIVRRC